MGDKKMYKQFMIIIICKIIMIIQVNAGGKMKVKTNADKKKSKYECGRRVWQILD